MLRNSLPASIAWDQTPLLRAFGLGNKGQTYLRGANVVLARRRALCRLPAWNFRPLIRRHRNVNFLLRLGSGLHARPRCQ